MKKLFSSAVLFILVFCACVMPVFADDIETDGKYTVVTVESQGENRLAAIESGLVEALRLASGSFIDSKTELNNEELTERIISYSRGSIAKYEVVMADDTKADEGIYNVKLKVWVESELLRDGVKVATNKTSKVSFKKSDLEPEKDDLKVAALENKDSMSETNKSNAESGVEALSAMLERYNPEDFINIKVVGKVTKVKGKEAQDVEDLCQVLVEVSFNDQLYNEAFIPDLKQVLDSIAAKKKDITLTKQRDILRRIDAKKGAPMADNSVVLSGADFGKDFSVAVYDKPDRFGCRLYGFKDDSEKILNNLNGVLAKFRGRIARLKGFEIELLDKDGGIVSTEEEKVTLPFLLTDSVIRNNVWAFHPSIMNYMGMYDYVPLYIENKAVTLPLRFELPEEFQNATEEINVKFIFEDDFAEAALKTRNSLHNAAINCLTKPANTADFEAAAEAEYPLAETAINFIKANEINNTNGLLLEENIDRLGEFRDKGSHAAFYYTALRLEGEIKNYENQKKCVPFYTQAAMVDPDAMIRMGEIYEQGFYDVKPNPKRAASYYKEGIRILSLLASQGMPSAALGLGRVYLEGLGTKQDTQRAERYYNFVKKAGYEAEEGWIWENYRFALRQIHMSKELGGNAQSRTCLYLVREKKPVTRAVYALMDGGSLINVTTADFYSFSQRIRRGYGYHGEWDFTGPGRVSGHFEFKGKQ